MRFDDGVFEVTFVRLPKNAAELQEILAAIVLKEMDTHYMISFRTARLTIEAQQEIPWTLDGEYGGESQNVIIRRRMQVRRYSKSSKGVADSYWKLKKVTKKIKLLAFLWGIVYFNSIRCSKSF